MIDVTDRDNGLCRVRAEELLIVILRGCGASSVSLTRKRNAIAGFVGRGKVAGSVLLPESFVPAKLRSWSDAMHL